jgi:hypothetical protein
MVCNNKVCDLNSESSEVCCKPKHNRCGGEPCVTNCTNQVDSCALFAEKSPAVVEVISQWILLGREGGSPTGDPITVANDEGPLPADGVRADVSITRTGFFVTRNTKLPRFNDDECRVKHERCKIRYIVTAFQNVALPSQVTGVVNRYPIDVNDTSLTARPEYVLASNIWVKVNNVNKNNCSSIYSAEIVGIDGAADLAMLRIKLDDCNFSHKIEHIKDCHPALRIMKIGHCEDQDGPAPCIGSDVLIMTPTSINRGTLANNKFTQPSGLFDIQGFKVYTSEKSRQVIGSPVISACNGLVIGYVTYINEDEGGNYVSGPISNFFYDHMKKLVSKTDCDVNYSNNNNDNAPVLFIGETESIAKYNRGFIGISARLVTPQDYNTTYDYSANPPVPRITLDSSGNLVNITPNNITGMMVTSTIPTTTPGWSGAVSPFLVDGTVITHLEVCDRNKYYFGDSRPYECKDGFRSAVYGNTISNVLWKYTPNNNVNLGIYQSANDVPTGSNSGFPIGQCKDLKIKLNNFPVYYDYPQYAIDIIKNDLPSWVSASLPSNPISYV